MFYRLTEDMERIDQAIEDGTNTISAYKSNMDDIEYEGIKKGFFRHIIYQGEKIENWPHIEFYYSPLASDLESDLLLNIKIWPIIHKRVQQKFEAEGITGVQYLPIDLVDTVYNKVNRNFVAMNVLNKTDAYDMEKSEYRYDNELNYYSFAPNKEYIDAKRCAGYDIFREKRDDISLYVSEKIKTIVEKNNWVGFDFFPMKVTE